MRRNATQSSALALVFITLSCGGGGGGSQTETIINHVTAPVGPGHTEVFIGQAAISLIFGNETTEVSLTETTPPRINQPAFQNLQPALTIDCPVIPSGEIKVSYPDSSAGQTLAVVALQGNTPIGAWPMSRENGRMVATISPELQQKSRGSSLFIKFVVGISTIPNPPENGSGLVRVGSAGVGRTVIFVPGLMQSVADVIESAKRAKDIGGYANAYVYRYDYRTGIAAEGRRFANFLTGSFPNKSVDIIGYSKGGLVAMWALQQENATAPVRRVLYLGTPVKGCSTSLARLYWAFGGVYFNNRNALPYAEMPSDCFAELMPNSQVISDLNEYQFVQNGDVDYYFFAGENDDIVNQDSAWAMNVPVGDATNGHIRRHTIHNVSHFSIDKPAAVEAAIRSISLSVTGVSLLADPAEPLQPDPFFGSWIVDIRIKNNISGPLTLESMQFEEFDRYGQWQGHYWYDPTLGPGIFFPHRRIAWNYSLPAGQAVVLGIEYWPNESQQAVWEAPESQQARTSHVMVQARDLTGRLHKAERIVEMRYGGIVPASPQTRSVFGEPGRLMPITLRK